VRHERGGRLFVHRVSARLPSHATSF
jgi:hypothetical protein